MCSNAKMIFHYGVMGAGKSQDLIRIWWTYTNGGEFKENALVLTSRKDTRASGSYVKTRAGDKIDATFVDDEFMAKDKKDIMFKLNSAGLITGIVDCILVDEIQFMTEEQVRFIKELSESYRVPVFAFGLMKDFQNNIFEGAAAALVYSETITEIKTICSHPSCRKKAIMNIRIDENGNKIKDGEQIVAGGDTLYKSVCYKHWKDWN